MENTLDLIVVNNKEKNNINKEIYRILKPGGYLFSVDKQNKAHNSVCDIEDIGFLIKDSISYFFKENEDIKQDVICLAMKPLSEKNFAENVMKWGAGGLNIDKCRIGNEKITIKGNNNINMFGGFKDKGELNIEHEGRYPANFIISEDVAPVLDKQSGYSKSSKSKERDELKEKTLYKGGWKEIHRTSFTDEGGASRYFYNSKSYKDLLRYITVLGLPPKESKVLFIGFDNADEIIEEINRDSDVSYEAITIGGIE